MPYRALCGALILALLAVPAAATLCTACISEHCPVRAEAGETPALPVTEAGETPALPAAEAGETPALPVAEAGETPALPVAEAGETPALPAVVPPCHGADPGVSNDAPPVAPITAECCGAAASPGNVPAASPDASPELRCSNMISAEATELGIRSGDALHQVAGLDARSRYSPPLYTLLSTLLI